jgi:hypothetical protein
MNVYMNCKRADGKKGLEVKTLPAKLAQAFFNAFVGKVVKAEGNEVKVTPLKDERKADSDILARNWDKIVKDYPTLDSIVIDGYLTSHSVPATLTSGEKVNKPVAFPAKMEVKNLNLVAILTGIANDLESEEGKISKGTKALYNASVIEEAEGYAKGKRGRTKKIINKAQREAELFSDL